MKKYLQILAITAFACTSNQERKKETNQRSTIKVCFDYPRKVDSLKLNSLYDSARWFIYTWHCDQRYMSKSDSIKPITFGELPLRFNNLNFKHDTIELTFVFMDNGRAVLPSMTKDLKQLSTGVGFDLKTNRKIYMLSPNGFYSTIKGGANRYENPLVPEVLNYIEMNWDNLDNCFKSLATQKGIQN